MEQRETHDEDKQSRRTSTPESNASDGSSDNEIEEDETSSSGSSSEEQTDSGEVEDEEGGIDGNTPPESPPLKVPKLAASPTALKSRLASFLPQIQQANAELENDPNATMKRIDHVSDDEERYIEMNLGLGVLKGTPTTQQRQDIKTTATGESESAGSGSEFDDQSSAETADVGIIDKLKGVKHAKRKIEEVG